VAHELDAAFLEAGDSEVTAASWYGTWMDPLSIDVTLRGEKNDLAVGDGTIAAIHWPGHSPGSLVYTASIQGDLVLFAQDVHGPIHPGLRSNEQDYQRSLVKLAALDADLLLEGHFGIIRTKAEVRAFIESFMR
jgi:glyoxylase-like metal-dependent hydrolase (beta-lactamase superfamily II)